MTAAATCLRQLAASSCLIQPSLKPCHVSKLINNLKTLTVCFQIFQMSASGPGGSGSSGSAPSQKHQIHCKYCDISIIFKNYKSHLSLKHPEEDQNDRTGKGSQSLFTFFPKRSRSSDDAVNKKRHCSGDSAIETGEEDDDDDVNRKANDESGVEEDVAGGGTLGPQQSSSMPGGSGLPGQVGKLPQDFGSTNLAPVNMSDEDNDDDIKTRDEEVTKVLSQNEDDGSTCLLKQQSSSMPGGSGLPGQVGKLPQDFGSTNLAPVNVTEDGDDKIETRDEEVTKVLSRNDRALLEEIKEIANRSENKIDLLLHGNFKDTKRDGNTVKESESLDEDVSRRITEARSMKVIEDMGFTHNTGSNLVICNICKESFKYDDEDTDFTKVGDLLPQKFRGLKRNIKTHLTRKVHTDKVKQINARDEEVTKVLSRNDRAGMIVFRQAYSHIKMRRPDRDFEKELFLLSKAGCDIGTINHSANLIGKFRPFLHKTIKLQISNFFSSPMIVTGFTPALAYTGMFACYNFFLGQ